MIAFWFLVGWLIGSVLVGMFLGKLFSLKDRGYDDDDKEV